MWSPSATNDLLEVARDELGGTHQLVGLFQRAPVQMGPAGPPRLGGGVPAEAMAGARHATGRAATEAPVQSLQVRALAHRVEIMQLEHDGYAPAMSDGHVLRRVVHEMTDENDVWLLFHEGTLEQLLEPPRIRQAAVGGTAPLHETNIDTADLR